MLEQEPKQREKKRNSCPRQIQSGHCLYQYLDMFSDTILFLYDLESGKIEASARENDKIDIPLLSYLVKRYSKKIQGEGEEYTFEFRMRQEFGPFYWCLCRLRACSENKRKYLVGKLTDISMQKEREDQLLFRSIKDGLTGVYNKITFEYLAEEALKRGLSGGLYMIDIDDFKMTNDIFGHAAGDKVLIKLGELLREIFHESDLIGRVGGDEFAVYIEGEEIREPAERLLRAVTDYVPEEGKHISVSIGIASRTGQIGEGYEELFSHADRAMYHAKQSGKNRIVVYEDL